MRGFLLVLAIPIVFVGVGVRFDLSRLSRATLVDHGSSHGAAEITSAGGSGELNDSAGNWRRTTQGWELVYDWPTVPKVLSSPNLAGQLHPAFLALIIGGAALGALVAGTPEELLLEGDGG